MAAKARATTKDRPSLGALVLSGVVFSLITTIGCKPADSESGLRDDGYRGSIRVMLGDDGSHEPGHYRFFFSVEGDVERGGVCLANSGSTSVTCREGASTYYPAHVVDQRGGRTFLEVENEVTPKEGLSLLLTTSLASGTRGEERTIVFTQNSGGQQTGGSLGVRQGTGASGSGASSGGSGGEKGRVVNGKRFTNGNFSSQYRVWAPSSNGPQTAHPLVVFLHGDTGSNFGPPELDSRIDRSLAAYGQDQPTLDQARAEAERNSSSMWNETIFVSILSPSENSSFITWSTDLTPEQRNGNADYVHELIQREIMPRYNVDLANVYFVGQSGGGVFLAGTFVPRHATKYRGGGAIFLCGADGIPASAGFRPSDDFKRHFKIHFHTTQNEMEQLITPITNGRDDYRRQMGQDNVQFKVEGQGTHCQFGRSQPTILNEVITAMKNANR